MKKWLSGFLTCLLLCGLVVTAGAKTGTVMQELTYRDIRVSLDGKVLDLRNAIGEPVEPFMFGGTNYLPVRALAEALGLDVAWNGAEVMVVLTTPEPPPEEPTPVKSASPGAIDCDINDCHITYLKHEIVENMAGDRCLAVYFQFTNNNKEAKSFIYTVSDKAYQNGVQLESSLFHVNDESHSKSLEVKTGVSITVCSAFVLRDETADVELDVAPWISLSDKVTDSMTLKLQ